MAAPWEGRESRFHYLHFTGEAIKAGRPCPSLSLSEASPESRTHSPHSCSTVNMDLTQEFAQSPSELKPEAKKSDHQLQLFPQDGPCGHPGRGEGRNGPRALGTPPWEQLTGRGRLLQKERSEVTISLASPCSEHAPIQQRPTNSLPLCTLAVPSTQRATLVTRKGFWAACLLFWLSGPCSEHAKCLCH